MKVTIPDLEYFTEATGSQAEFGNPISEFCKEMVQKKAFLYPRELAASCIRWIWYQWLLKGDVQEVRKNVESFVARGLKIRELSSAHKMRSIHDLYLLHCAIFACNRKLLLKTAECVEAAPHKPETLPNFGEKYAAACCGMLKYRILEDEKKAAEQFDLIWTSYRGDPSFRAAPKPLIVPWLEKKWETFIKIQHKDFERLWSQARKYQLIRKDTKEETVVALKTYPVQEAWCWAHCGLALLAYRLDGIEIATDHLWFPPYALKVVPKP